MSKLKIFYILSLVLLGVLVMFTVLRPLATGEEYSETQGTYLLEKEDEWIIELHLLNYEDEETSYKIDTLVDGNLYTDTVPIQPDRVFKYIVHIDKDTLNTGEVSLAVYKEGEDAPIEQTTYYLK